MMTELSNLELQEINGGELNELTEGLLYGIARTAAFSVFELATLCLLTFHSL